MTVYITAKDVGLEFPTKKVFGSFTLGINSGEMIGIVGKNGDGKSTLLALLSGALEPDSGEVIRRSSVTIGALSQADDLDDEATVAQATVGDAPEYTWAADRRTRDIIDALLSDVAWDAQVKTLSGGQRRRVDLARLLIGEWDVLMLDEPTNHLDMQAISWLAGHLKQRWPKGDGTLLTVTHDRWFLDEVCTSMWEVHGGIVEAFEGGFSAYVLQRVERDRLIQLAETKRQNLMRKELAWLSRGARARATKPKFHLKVAQELIEGDPPIRNKIELRKAAVARLGKQVVEMEDVTVRFDDKTVLDKVSWLIGPGDRIGILGANGAGKTTLLRTIQGMVRPSSGRVKIGKTVRFASSTQRLEELEELSGDRVREVLTRSKSRLTIDDGKSVTSAKLLERLGFERSHLQARVGDLSGGQKRRLQLLLTLLEEPNVLILDEPGNDMDTDMLAVMEDLLDGWPGTLILVSHDRYLTERVTDDQFAILDGKVRHMPGGVDEFLEVLAKRDGSRREALSQGSAPNGRDVRGGSNGAGMRGGSHGGGVSSDSNGSASADASPTLTGGEAYQAKKLVSSIERKLATLEAQAVEVEARMHQADPSDYIGLGRLEGELQDVKAKIAELEEQWMELSEQLGE